MNIICKTFCSSGVNHNFNCQLFFNSTLTQTASNKPFSFLIKVNLFTRACSTKAEVKISLHSCCNNNNLLQDLKVVFYSKGFHRMVLAHLFDKKSCSLCFLLSCCGKSDINYKTNVLSEWFLLSMLIISSIWRSWTNQR